MKCIRVLADVNQIRQCRENISRLEKHTKSISSVLSLTGNQVRLKILFLLYKEGEMCPCDLSDILNMTVPAISQHLRKLKDGGLVKDKKVGQTVFYSVIEENIGLVKTILKDLVKLTNEEPVK